MSLASNYSLNQPITGFLGTYFLSNNIYPISVAKNNVPSYLNENVIILPFGAYIGTLELAFTGGNDTAIQKLSILTSLDKTGDVISRNQYFTSQTLPNTETNYISVPILLNINIPTETAINFLIIAEYSGTDISIPADTGVKIKLSKVI